MVGGSQNGALNYIPALIERRYEEIPLKDKEFIVQNNISDANLS